MVLLAAAAALLFAEGQDAKVELSGERMDIYKIRPGSGVGPVKIGMSRDDAKSMSRDDAKRAMETTGHRDASMAVNFRS